MDENARPSIIDRISQRIMKAGLTVLKVIYILPFAVFGLWLLSHVYISGFNIESFSSVSTEGQGDDLLASILKQKGSVPRDHFHMTDEYVVQQDPNPPVCVICHGTYAHGKEKKVRSLLNLHSGFIACSVCHVRRDGADTELGKTVFDDEFNFMWVDRQTGDFSNTVEGEYGKYPAMIYPIKSSGQGHGRIFAPIRTEAAQQFLKMYPQLTTDQISEAKAKLHELVSEEPVSCKDCHKKDGYLDFARLGFPAQRVDHLESSEIVGMIENYKTFYLPSVVDFRGE